MATPFQLAANRRNAKFSTGPRTPAGKQASSRNATKHNLTGSTFAILPGEDVDAFERLAREYREEWKPRTPHEIFLVNSMVQARWRLDRIARLEAEAFDQLLDTPVADGKSDEAALVALYPLRGDLLDRLHRYAQQNQRAYHKAVKELQQYRKQLAAAKQQIQNEPNSVLTAFRSSGVESRTAPPSISPDSSILSSELPFPHSIPERMDVNSTSAEIHTIGC